MATSGLMKYPRDASRVCPVVVATVYSNQFPAISTPATVSASTAEPSRNNRMNRPTEWVTASISRQTTREKTMRRATISYAVAGARTTKYRGSNPQIPYAANP